MDRARPQQHRLSWPLTPQQIQGIDEMFETLFRVQRGRIPLTPTSMSGVLTVPNGGTGIASYVIGDLLYASATTTLSRLADVATGNALISGGVGIAPAWGKIGLSTHTTGVLPVANGGTNISSYAVGDLLYASGATTLAKLADVATGNALISGGVTTAPSWGKIGLTTHVSGVLPVANGGTNQSSWTAGSVVFAGVSGASLAESNGAFFFNNSTGGLCLGGTEATLTINGSSISPHFNVHDESTVPAIVVHRHVAGDGSSHSGNGVLFARSRGTVASKTVVENSDLLGDVVFLGFDGTDYEPAAAITVYVHETTPASDKMGGKLILKTTSAGTAALTTALTIDNAQVVTLAQPLPVASGGTGIASYAVGDLLYASGTTALSKLADVATGNALISGGVTTAPSWGKIGLTTHVSDTLPVANGGTGIATLTANRIPYGNGTSAFQSASNFTFDGTVLTTPGQIKFPATQNASSDANTLDDFEEGTWTPTIGGSTSESGQVYSVQDGQYVKWGKIVYVTCTVQLSTLGTITGVVSIKGLPFASDSGTNYRGLTPVTWSNLTTGFYLIQGVLGNNASIVSLVGTVGAATSVAATTLAQADLTANSRFVIGFSYITQG